MGDWVDKVLAERKRANGNLATLNSLTKYPSIPTYHAFGEKGALLEDRNVDFGPDDSVVLTEKIDGINARIIVRGDGEQWILGSRNDLLGASSDVLHNPAMGIVDMLTPDAYRALMEERTYGLVLYGEVYGGKVTAQSKQYTGKRALGFRLFDACRIRYEVQDQCPEWIAAWRESGGQSFLPEDELRDLANRLDLELTPRLSYPLKGWGYDVAETLYHLEEILPHTLAGLDTGAGRTPEGLVIRTPDRSKIAKIRFQDYRRTMARRG